MTNFLDFKPDSLSSSLLTSTMRCSTFYKNVVHFGAIYHHSKTEDGLNLSTCDYNEFMNASCRVLHVGVSTTLRHITKFTDRSFDSLHGMMKLRAKKLA